MAPGRVGSLASFFADNDIQHCGIAFAHAALEVVRVVPGDCSFVDEYLLAGVVGMDEAVSVIYVKPFNGSKYAFFIAVSKAVLFLPE